MRRDVLVSPAIGSGAALAGNDQPGSAGAIVHRSRQRATSILPESASVLLTVTDVRQYFYCPRIVYYRLCQPLRRPMTYKMREGKLAQDRTANLEQERSLAAYGLTAGERHFNVGLRSETLGLQGIIDMVIVTAGEAIPVEFKNTTRPPARNHTYQVAAYALLLEERWGLRVRRGFVYRIPLKDATELRLTPTHRSAVRRALTAMRQMVAREQQPEPTVHRERCRECEYRCFCGDIE